MHGLPANFDSSSLVGIKLSQVCFTANTVSLFFEKDVSITIMGSFIYRDKLSPAVNKQRIPLSSSNLMSLVSKVVRLAEAREDGTLILHFENEHALMLLDDSREYESYVIRIGNKEIIV